MTKKLSFALLSLLLLSACTNYFSQYRTVYRIETTDGHRYYSSRQPSLNKSAGIYEIKDLDGNEYRIKQDLIYKVEKYKHKK
ncbi:MAG: hypothetical protein CR975_03390 [Gammaproteobacteria bacterium]|nr:MAG: hypothetical protein CR975_03390 [Gammaproteobacteria bacterium]